MLVNALFYKLPCKNKTYKDFNYFTFSSPHFVYCPPNLEPSSSPIFKVIKVLLTLCVVALGPVVAGPALPKDKVVRTEDLVR